MGSATLETLALETRDLTVRYGRREVLRGVSFAVPPGTVYALLGRNGTGKSSFVRCALGQQRATAGTTKLFGRDAWKTRAHAMKRVGVVPEEPDAPPEMSTRALASFCGRFYPAWKGQDVADRLARLDVPMNVPFARLSKGQKGAVMLSLALGHSPELLVLDDPTLGLDVVARRGFFDTLVGELADRGTTVFMTSHDLDGIEAVATHVGILAEGRLVANESLEGLKARFRRIVAPSGTSLPADALAPLLPFAVETRSLDTSTVVSRFADSTWDEIRSAWDGPAQLEPMSLEEIFVAVAQHGKGAAS
jgi:ABC-2 type transport system ATP-binding protein